MNCNQYGICESDLLFGVRVGFLSWPDPPLQPMVGRILSYDGVKDQVVILMDNEVYLSRFSLIMDIS